MIQGILFITLSVLCSLVARTLISTSRPESWIHVRASTQASPEQRQRVARLDRYLRNAQASVVYVLAVGFSYVLSLRFRVIERQAPIWFTLGAYASIVLLVGAFALLIGHLCRPRAKGEPVPFGRTLVAISVLFSAYLYLWALPSVVIHAVAASRLHPLPGFVVAAIWLGVVVLLGAIFGGAAFIRVRHDRREKSTTVA